MNDESSVSRYLASNLLELRKRKDLSQDKLSDRAGISTGISSTGH